MFWNTYVKFVFNKCDLVFGGIPGKILHGKVNILCHNFNINPRIIEVKAGQVLRWPPFHHIKSILQDFIFSAIRLCANPACRKSRLFDSFVNM